MDIRLAAEILRCDVESGYLNTENPFFGFCTYQSMDYETFILAMQNSLQIWHVRGLLDFSQAIDLSARYYIE